VIIDMGDKIEAAILATSYCAKLHIKIIVVKAETEALGEILELVGATKVVFPNKEAAKRVTPLLLSSALLTYLPVSRTLSIAELAIPVPVIGKTLIEAELRKKYHLNLISIRDPDEEFVSCAPDYRFKSGDIGLFSGSDEDLNHFVGFIPEQSAAAAEEPHTLRERFFNLFRKR
jgi:trk system potassium uptake protein TrkA